MNEFIPLAVITGDLDSRSDAALRDLITKADAILKSREAGRRKQALAEIKRLAKENGLDVNVIKKPKRLGRPPKKDGPAGGEKR